MSLKFETVKAGDVLYDVHRHTMGNTRTTAMGTWTVHIVSIDHEKRRAMVAWNGNAATCWTAKRVEKLRRNPPKPKPSVVR